MPGLCLALAACQVAGPPPPDASLEQEHLAGALAGREWFSLAMAIADRDTGSDDPVDDGAALTLEGGYELNRAPLRPSIEIGATWSEHDIEGASGDDLDVIRIVMGLRLALHELRAPVLPYVRVGAFYRWSTDDEEDEFGIESQSGRGWYWGVGVDWLTEPGVAFGPFFTVYDGAEDDLEEHLYGLEASFRF